MSTYISKYVPNLLTYCHTYLNKDVKQLNIVSLSPAHHTSNWHNWQGKNKFTQFMCGDPFFFLLCFYTTALPVLHSLNKGVEPIAQ